jgi:hypothetical protein
MGGVKKRFFRAIKRQSPGKPWFSGASGFDLMKVNEINRKP